MTLVFPLDPLVETVPAALLAPVDELLLVVPPLPPVEDVDELLWWLLLFERSPNPLMRFESSAEARSTTPWADIDDIFIMCAELMAVPIYRWSFEVSGTLLLLL